MLDVYPGIIGCGGNKMQYGYSRMQDVSLPDDERCEK
jgi:hypothetical protein